MRQARRHPNEGGDHPANDDHQIKNQGNNSLPRDETEEIVSGPIADLVHRCNLVLLHPRPYL
jgi:hypothetical protein